MPKENKKGRPVEKKTGLFLVIGVFLLSATYLYFGYLFGFSAPEAQAANPPSIITYQGKLLINNLAASTTQSMKFILYDALTNGTALYSASGTIASPLAVNVTPTSGLFSVDLGGSGTNDLAPEIFRDNASVYLEVQVGSETLSPRKQITAVPYAFNAKYLDGVGTNTVSTTTYIPVSASDGSFTFNTTTLATTTVSGPLTLGAGTGYSQGKFYIDSATGNVSASGTLRIFSNSTFSGYLYPSDDNLYDLGASSTQWRYLNLQGGALIGDGSTTSTLLNNSLILGQASGFNIGRFYVDSSGNVSASSSLRVFSNVTSTGIVYASGGLISSASSTFTSNLSITGNLTAINGVSYTWPSSQGGLNTCLINDSSGGLSWGSCSAGGTNEWGRFSTTYGALALMTSTTYPVWFDSAVYASSTLFVSGNTELGNSDAAGGDTTRVYGALSMGVAPAGYSQLTVQATSTIAIPLAVFNNDGRLIFEAVSSSINYIHESTGQQTAVYDNAVLKIGNNTEAGILSIIGDGYFQMLNSSENVGVQISLPNSASPFSGLLMGDGSNTSTLSHTYFSLGRENNYNVGKFFIDASGNVSASGTLRSFGNATLGDSDDAGGDLHRIYGSLAMGAASIGNAQLFLSASSTTAVPLAIRANALGTGNLIEFQNNSGNYIGGFASTTSGGANNLILNLGDETAVMSGILRIWSDTGLKTEIIGGSLTVGYQESNYRSGIFYVDPSGNVSASGTLRSFNNATLGDSDGAGGDSHRIYGSLAMGAAPTGNAQLYLKATSTTAIPLIIQSSIGNIGATYDYLTQWLDADGNRIGYIATTTQTITFPSGAAFNVREASSLTLGDNSRLGYVGIYGGGAVAMFDTDGVLTALLHSTGIEFSDNSNSTTSTFNSGELMFYKTSGFNQGKFYVDSSGNVSASGTVKFPGISNATGDAVCRNATTGEITYKSGGTDCTVSSLRFKEQIEDYSKGLSITKQLRPVQYVFKDSGLSGIGLIAEELDLVEPLLVDYEPDGVTPRSVNYGQLTAVLINAVRELDLAVANLSANSTLQVAQDNTGQLIQTGNLLMFGQSILNLAGINTEADKWMIDADGYLVMKIDTSQGEKRLYSLFSGAGREIIFSSSNQLEAGRKRIEFALIDREIIDQNEPIKVIVTLTSEATNGIFVTEKSYQGFTVKEMNNGANNATFDWVVIAKRRGLTQMMQTNADLTQNVEDEPGEESGIMNNESGNEIVNDTVNQPESVQPQEEPASPVEEQTSAEESTPQEETTSVQEPAAEENPVVEETAQEPTPEPQSEPASEPAPESAAEPEPEPEPEPVSSESAPPEPAPAPTEAPAPSEPVSSESAPPEPAPAD